MRYCMPWSGPGSITFSVVRGRVVVLLVQLFVSHNSLIFLNTAYRSSADVHFRLRLCHESVQWEPSRGQDDLETDRWRYPATMQSPSLIDAQFIVNPQGRYPLLN